MYNSINGETVSNPAIDGFDYSTEVGCLYVKEVNRWNQEALETPDPITLHGSLWYEGEVACLFADSNTGKSLYAVQVAREIAKQQRVLLFDFEQTGKQFQMRYTDDNGTLYKFPENLLRAEINPEKFSADEDFEQSVISDIEQCAVRCQATVLIIDNLTFLCSKSEAADSASMLMTALLQLKKKYGWSILVLAHTPKRELNSPLTANDLAGSKRLFNFFDSVFAMGKTAKDENLRYIKQIKVRSSALEYGEDNVILTELCREDGFVGFNFREYTQESKLLSKPRKSREETIAEAKALQAEGYSTREIAELLDISKSAAQRMLASTNTAA